MGNKELFLYWCKIAEEKLSELQKIPPWVLFLQENVSRWVWAIRFSFASRQMDCVPCDIEFSLPRVPLIMNVTEYPFQMVFGLLPQVENKGSGVWFGVELERDGAAGEHGLVSALWGPGTWSVPGEQLKAALWGEDFYCFSSARDWFQALLPQSKRVRKHGMGINTTLWQVRKERCLDSVAPWHLELGLLLFWLHCSHLEDPWEGQLAARREGAGGCSPITFTALILSLRGESLQWNPRKCNSLQPKAASSNWFGLLFLWVYCSNNTGCWSSEGGFDQRAWALGNHFVAVTAHTLSEFPR